MSRTSKTLVNAKVNVIFYVVLFIVTLFSRKAFISGLGNDLIGLNATIQNFLGILNLAELGLWPATAYALYKYIHDDDKFKISEILSLFGRLYKIIGLVILGAGIIALFFLPSMFHDSGVSLTFVYAAFATFLYSSLLGYFFNYKQILIVADQKNYVTVIISNTILIVKVLLQLACLYYLTNSYYTWLGLEIVFATLNTVYLNHYVKKLYPWLILPKFNKSLLKSHDGIIKNMKRLFSHKFASVVILQSDSVLIFFFSGLTQVAIFSNYTLLISRATGFFISLLNSSSQSVGNLVASQDDDKIKSIFWELTSMRYWITGIIIICAFYMVDPFIVLWLGQGFLLSKTILILLLFNAYISITRLSVDTYMEAYGLFGHVWAPWTEAILNLGLSSLLGYKYGIAGVLTGTAISLIVIVCIWRPYYLFKSGFKNGDIMDYWVNIFKYVATLAIVWLIVHYIATIPFISSVNSYWTLAVRMMVIFLTSSILYGMILYMTSAGMKKFSQRMFSFAKEKLAQRKFSNSI